MLASPYAGYFKDDITSWEAKVTLMQEVIDEWLKVQATWLYLEPIFGSADIKHQLPLESEKFDRVDKIWREIMDICSRTSKMMDMIKTPDLDKNLRESNEELEIIQKGLNHYLETKRLAFPR